MSLVTMEYPPNQAIAMVAALPLRKCRRMLVCVISRRHFVTVRSVDSLTAYYLGKFYAEETYALRGVKRRDPLAKYMSRAWAKMSRAHADPDTWGAEGPRR